MGVGRVIGCAVLCATAAMASGCAPSLYDWRGFEKSVYAFYTQPGEVSLLKQRGKLESEIDRTLASGKPVPPGKYAHLGYVCFLTGDRQEAIRFLNAEKQAFPESTQLVDVLLEQLR